jgi:hypothetical protein
MPDIRPNTDDWKKFSQGLQAETAEHARSGGDAMAPWGGGLVQKGVEYGAAFGRGALKQAAEAPGLRAIEPQGIADWAKEVDPKHPDVEGAGRYVTPTNVILGRLPDLPMLAASANAPWALRAGSKLMQNAWKSTAGGAAQANLDTPSGDEAGRRVARGAAEGLGTGLAVTGGQAAIRAMPYWAVPALIAGGELAHGRFMPWHIRHAIAAGLAALAARAAHIPAGLVGAGGEAAAQKMQYEPGSSAPSEPQDEIISR